MKRIPNELSSQFDTLAGRRKLIELYGDSDTMFSGVNADGEDVCLSISEIGMTLKTNQSNGWVRVNYYDAEGYADGETYDGRWNATAE